jgi:uncharacterized membrane protein
MMRGYGIFGWGMGTGFIWWIFLGLVLIAGIVLLIVYLARPHKVTECCTPQQPQTLGGNARVQAILKDKFAAGHIGFADYEERRLVLEGSMSDDLASADLAYLKEKYARCEIDTKEYIERRGQILGTNGQK